MIIRILIAVIVLALALWIVGELLDARLARVLRVVILVLFLIWLLSNFLVLP